MKAGMFIALCLALAAPAAAATRNVVAQDSNGITLAVLRGDAPALQRIGKSESVARLAGRAGYYRVRGDIAQSNRWADACIADAAVLAEKNHGTLYLCRSLRAGNRLIEGDVAGWATDMLQVRALYQHHVAPQLQPGEGVHALTEPAFARFSHWPTSTTLQAPVTAGTRLAVSDRAGVPVARGTLRDGRDGTRRAIESDFIVDTGATHSHLSRQAAQAMGLAVTEGFAVEDAGTGHPVRIGLATPLDLEFNGIHFKDVAFTVTDTMPVNLIGLDLLRRLGPFVLRGGQLETLAALPAACQSPLSVTSGLWGEQYSLRLPMRIGKRDERVLLDTGSNGVLEASGISLAGYPPQALVQTQRLTVHGMQPVRHAEATSPVTFNGITATLPTRVNDQPARVFPVAWTLGYGLHDRYDYYLDVANARGCLLPVPPPG
ncbi:retropepsin-like aspartic protease [Stenotrophomonas sp. 24(2023)]|uniref:retropepsin-like aspartic protease n=1 Tax=Stenotrophomonas sp. 24(2023) TaxID=3068324 RepID=UPI0027DF5A4D|nr:retropepsin-like aspartic protease [Stenotrophomonas sp. 24(2023)]WMJ67639.1 retropepsin-like aspartic protease [Stenotrophomonas sp. 24(2023)]